MFINCPYCRALVATDPVTDAPPSHCPHCDSLLRRDHAADTDADDATQAEPAPLDVAALLAMTAPERDGLAGEPPRSAAVSAEPVGAEVVGTDPAAAAVAAPPVAAVVPRSARALPSFLRGRAHAASRPRERWVPAVAIALALLLMLQLLLADRARLAADARWRPVLQVLCTALRCDLPPWREPSAFTLVQRDVRQHPQLPGALRVTATFRNDARWAQPWPQLQLRLSDGNGRTAGERSFRVEEYLGGAPSQAELGSGETASVAMDILEPAPGIVGYDFSFR